MPNEICNRLNSSTQQPFDINYFKTARSIELYYLVVQVEEDDLFTTNTD